MTNRQQKVCINQIFSCYQHYYYLIIIIVGLFGANAGVKGSGKNDRSSARKSVPKPPNTAESSQAQTQRGQSNSNVNFNTGSPSAAKFWSSFFQQQQQQSVEDAATGSWGGGDTYDYDDVEAEAEEYFRDAVDYRSNGRSYSNSRSVGDRYATDGSLTSLLVRRSLICQDFVFYSKCCQHILHFLYPLLSLLLMRLLDVSPHLTLTLPLCI